MFFPSPTKEPVPVLMKGEKMMKKRFWMFFAIMLLSIAMAFPAMAFAQNGSESSYTVTYTDPSGSFTDQVY